MSGGRNIALDGLRGWAAFAVLGYHFYFDLTRAFVPEPVANLIAAIFNGPLAVAIFFVLSGYVLTFGAWGAVDKGPTIRQMLKRYPRLAIPILATTTLVLCLAAAGLTFGVPAGAIIGNAKFGMWLQFPLNLPDALDYALRRVFTPELDRVYEPHLWTMRLELWMAWFLLAFCLLEARLSRAFVYGILIVLAVAAVPLNCGISCFFAGALLALARRERRLGFRLGNGPALCLAIAAAAICVFFGQTIPDAAALIVAVAVVILVLLSPRADAALSSPLSQLLGRLSFPLYLMQFPILISITAWSIAALGPSYNAGYGVAIGTGSIALTFLAAAAFLPVETLTHRIGRFIDRLQVARSSVERHSTSKATAGTLAGE